MPSTVIRAFRYHAATRELDVEFTSGRCYRYLGVPAEIAVAMRAAFSKGSYFNRHIRDKFAFREQALDASDPDIAASGGQ
jgi:lysyl-tRNA synthetase class 2